MIRGMNMSVRRLIAAASARAPLPSAWLPRPAQRRAAGSGRDRSRLCARLDLIVNTERKVYYVIGAGRAIRYGVAVGKESERWTGRTFVSDKKVDPRWIPIDGQEPVEGGDPSNPLGQRALYLDWSLLRIHGTPSRGSIGSAVSNGCIRMLNEDVIDLFDRVHVGAPVFAINSLKDAGSFKDAKVADLVRQSEARLDAQVSAPACWTIGMAASSTCRTLPRAAAARYYRNTARPRRLVGRLEPLKPAQE
jgi:hypothetical protein